MTDFMEIDPGKLIHRIVLQRLDPNIQYDSTGDIIQNTDSWDSIGPFWCRVKPLSGKELMNARQLVDQVTHQVTMRNIGVITPQDRFIYQGTRVFGIDYVLNDDEFNACYSIFAHELIGETP